jgi:hypothetical protein
MRLVRQPEEHGCAIACLAMVLGTTYEKVRNQWLNDFSEEGVELEKTMNFLGEKGYSLVHKEVRNWGNHNFGRKEMLKPFAPIHLVKIIPQFDAPSGHLVVMDRKGKLYCPAGHSDKEVRDCYHVASVIGVYK